MSSAHLARKGPYWYVVVAWRDEDGKRRQRWDATGTTDEGQAKEALRKAREQLRAGMRLEEDPTVAAWLETWLSGARVNLRPKTIDDYERFISRQIGPRIGETKLRDLQPVDVQRLDAELLARGGKDGRALSVATVRACHACLQAALRAAEEHGLVLRNAARLARRPKLPHREREWIPADEASALLEAVHGDPWVPFLEFGFLTGLRRGELLGLHWSDWDELHHTLRVSRQRMRLPGRAGVAEVEVKTRAGNRALWLDERAEEILRQIRRKQREESLAAGVPPPQLVFCHRIRPQEWTGWSPDAAGRALKRLYKLAGRPMPSRPVHILRHSHLSGIAEEGMSPRAAQDRAGHESSALTLDVYMHADIEAQKKATSAFAKRLRPERLKRGRRRPPKAR